MSTTPTTEVDFSGYGLGRLAPVDKPAISFGEHLIQAPVAPLADPVPQLSYPMDLNDRFGDCVVAAGDHALQVIYTALTGSYTNWTDDEIISWYKTQNPDFDPQTGAGDNGMVVQLFLETLVKAGVILGFAKVDHTNEAEMDDAIYLGLAIITGENLTVAQQNQSVWDTVDNDTEWGGHATASAGYPDASRDTCITWGTTIDMTERFVQQSVEEAWFIVTQAHVDHPSFRAGYDLNSFAAAYKQLTGRDFPVPVNPPAPTPSPTPTPVTTDPDATFASVIKSWISYRHVGRNHIMALAAKQWLADKGL